jgi:hypothetical protein
VFALDGEHDAEARLNAEMLHEMLTARPLDKSYQPAKRELSNLLALLACILEGDREGFHEALLERCELRREALADASGDASLSIIDWVALALACLAADRGMSVSVDHAYLPFVLLEASKRLVRH